MKIEKVKFKHRNKDHIIDVARVDNIQELENLLGAEAIPLANQVLFEHAKKAYLRSKKKKWIKVRLSELDASTRQTLQDLGLL